MGRSLVLLLAPLAMAATMGSNKGRDSRHYWGQNMTVPRSFQNMGSINVAGVGQLYVVTQDPSTVQMVDNGFRLVGGGRVYLAQEAANDFSNPYIYWQLCYLVQLCPGCEQELTKSKGSRC